MSKLKAVRILEDIKINKDGLGLELHPNCVTDDIEFALDELKELLNRGCSNCKHEVEWVNGYRCNLGISISFIKDFMTDMGCNKWEHK